MEVVMIKTEVKDQSRVINAQGAATGEVKYQIKGDDVNLPFSVKDGYNDASAILRAHNMMGSLSGIKLYKIVGCEKTVIFPSDKKKL